MGLPPHGSKFGKFQKQIRKQTSGVKGTIRLLREQCDPSSTIDPDWLEKEINQVARTAYNAGGLSKKMAALVAMNSFASDLRRLMPYAYADEAGGINIAKLEGWTGFLTTPAKEKASEVSST